MEYENLFTKIKEAGTKNLGSLLEENYSKDTHEDYCSFLFGVSCSSELSKEKREAIRQYLSKKEYNIGWDGDY